MHKEGWDNLARNGQPALAEMSRHFHKIAHMDQALGYAGAIKHWVSGKNRASPAAELSARRWLDLNIKSAPAPEKPITKGAPPAPKEIPASGKLFLVAAPLGVSDKVERVLAMLGCEVTEV
tara:strand:- start:23349 stop:23711 length:363 start_codon:yes stop_codon:yes gene_type:complete